MSFDFAGENTEVLLNPRLASEEARVLRAELGAFPELKGHFWVATSGSTGRMKWVALSKQAVLAAAAGANAHLRSDARDTWLLALPTFHVGGLGILARAWLSGARVASLATPEGKWSAAAFARDCEEVRATVSSLVPAQVHDLVREGLRAPGSLRAIVVGGGALSESLYRSARALCWPLLPSYGLSECASQVATATLESLGSGSAPELKLLPHVAARTNAEGLIELRSEALLTGYGMGERFFDPKREGWFTTEDRGELVTGRLRVLGRAGSFLKIGGESVDFSRLERLLEEACAELGSELEALLVAVPEERLGHVIELVFAPSTGAALVQAQRLREAYDRKVLPVERIRAVWPLERIPRSPLGKPLRAELLAARAAGAAAVRN
ncbi:MAG: AMP-binding protein [Oligoflexia bacterium]|nr:AMP-binding protein [Oligoflexia bacterium]